MARITLYNSTATATTEGFLLPGAVDRWPATLAAANSEADSGRSAGARLVGIEEDIRFISYEFFMEFSAPTDVVKLRWFQEFFSDTAFPFFSPTMQALAATRGGNSSGFTTNNAVWMREVALVDGGLGQLDMYPITRRMDLIPVPFAPTATKPYQVSLHVPLTVHANWVRIAFWIDFAASTIGVVGDLNLYIMGHVGGHTEFEYLQDAANLGVPYAYDAYRNKPLPLGAKVIKRGGS